VSNVINGILNFVKKNLEENCNMSNHEPIQTIDDTFDEDGLCELCGEIFPCDENVLLEHIADHRS
jgi:hypothetical protein